MLAAGDLSSSFAAPTLCSSIFGLYLDRSWKKKLEQTSVAVVSLPFFLMSFTSRLGWQLTDLTDLDF